MGKPFDSMPSPPGSLLGGHLASLRSGYLDFFSRCAREHGDSVRLRFAHQGSAFFSHPDDIARVIVKNHRNYVKQTPSYDAFRLLVGNGLVTSEGDFWRRQRRITQPSFHRERLEGFARTMLDATARVAERWRTRADEGRVFDVGESMLELTLEIVGRTLMSLDSVGSAHEVAEALDVALHHVVKRSMRPFMPPLFVPTGENRRFQRALGTLDRIVNGIIDARQPAGDGAHDLLSMWMEARDVETGERMSRRQLRDEVMTMYLAGHETSATMLTWVWYVLAQDAEVEAQLHDELDRVLDGRPPELGDLAQLPYTRLVIDETLRLYPPVPLIARWSLAPDEVGGYEIPKDLFIFFSPFVTHRHPEFWPDPERFDPERFRDPGLDRTALGYFPFLGGPRQCIGNSFALMNGQLSLAYLASRFRVRRADARQIELDATVSLRPKGGLAVKVEPRR